MGLAQAWLHSSMLAARGGGKTGAQGLPAVLIPFLLAVGGGARGSIFCPPQAEDMLDPKGTSEMYVLTKSDCLTTSAYSLLAAHAAQFLLSTYYMPALF